MYVQVRYSEPARICFSGVSPTDIAASGGRRVIGAVRLLTLFHKWLHIAELYCVFSVVDRQLERRRRTLVFFFSLSLLPLV